MSADAIPLRARLAAAVLDRSPDWSAMAASQAMGLAARIPLPRPLSRAVVGAYSRYFGVALDEADPDPLRRGYANFNAFFTRTLREGARSIDGDPLRLVAPCDGALRDATPIERGRAIVAKGHPFTIAELVADEDLAEHFVGGSAVVIYLHPRDYHRVHSPVDARATGITLIPGRLLPVTDASLRREPRVFALNERMVHVLDTEFGVMAVVMVAAFGVGHMSCGYRRVPPHPDRIVRESFEPGIRVGRGDELGIFHLGSTVVLVVGPGWQADAPSGRVLLGEPILRRKAA